jgi:hypothetical protein
MASAITKIETVTVGSGGASSILFTAIPQTYTDLIIKISPRSTKADTVSNLALQFNGSATSYVNRIVYGDGASAGSYSNNFTTYGHIGTMNAANSTANTFTSSDVYIPNYTVGSYKTFSADTVSESNSSTAYQVRDFTLWSNTAAITSIELFTITTGNFAQYTTATLYGVTKYVQTGTGSKATGGTVTTSGGYTYHTFYSSGVFTPTTSITADFLVVAGGGAGGHDTGGGGGAGGLRSSVGTTGGGGSLESALSLTAQAYTVIVGAGGSGSNSSYRGSNGTNSVFSSISATGGGGGGTNSLSSGSGANGGSGGGGSAYGAVPSGAAGTGTANQGYAGGAGANGNSGGGGGGAGAVGSSGSTSTGGNGVICSNFANATSTGVSTYYAGGGGGGGTSSSSGGKSGGFGGGGAGGSATTNTFGLPGVANTGGGGGGGRDDGAAAGRTGGAGASGIVIIRYTT